MLDHSVLNYDPITGFFRWKINRANKKAGDIAGNVGPNGYRTIMISYRFYYAHHLAWFFMHGRFPPKGTHVDHINGDRGDNRIANLRVTTPSKNNLNRKRLNKNNRSGAIGVWQKPNGKFEAYIWINWKKVNLGTFNSFQHAKAAREAAHAKHS